MKPRALWWPVYPGDLLAWRWGYDMDINKANWLVHLVISAEHPSDETRDRRAVQNVTLLSEQGLTRFRLIHGMQSVTTIYRIRT